MITADEGPAVDVTTNIRGPLPNRVFTLSPATILAVLSAASVTREVHYMCRKFAIVSREGAREALQHTDEGTTTTLMYGRLWSSGNNCCGRCGVGDTAIWCDRPRWVRLPPVLSVWHGYGGWIARTERGLYCWGANLSHQLGGGPQSPMVRKPVPVQLSGDVIDVVLHEHYVFFELLDGSWCVSGANAHQQLQDSRDSFIDAPIPFPGSRGVDRWWSSWSTIFALVPAHRILASGPADNDLLLMPSEDAHPGHLEPVRLPDSLHGADVLSMALLPHTTIAVTSQGVLAAGFNRFSFTGAPGTLDVPTLVDIPAVAVAAVSCSTIYQTSDGTLLAVGNNPGLFPGPDEIYPPAPLPTPPGAQTLVLADFAMFAGPDDDGTWFTRGDNRHLALGLPNARIIREWQPIPQQGILAVWPQTVQWTAFLTHEGLLAAGANRLDRLGVGPGAPESVTCMPMVEERIIGTNPPVLYLCDQNERTIF